MIEQILDTLVQMREDRINVLNEILEKEQLVAECEEKLKDAKRELDGAVFRRDLITAHIGSQWTLLKNELSTTTFDTEVL